MRKILTLTILTAAAISLTGCEAFNRFEAWKMETLFGEPNPYNPPQPYPYPYAQAPYGQPVAAPPAGVIQLQPGQPLPPGYVVVQPPATASVMAPTPSVTPAGPQTLLPASPN